MYTLTDLGASSSPTAINLVGQVVGNLNGQSFLWTKSTGLQNLGILSGGTFSHAYAINDFGTVTGIADGPFTVIAPPLVGLEDQQCSNLPQPFIWTQSDGMTGLGTIIETLPFGVAEYPNWCLIPFKGTGVNNFGQVVGDVGSYSTYQWGFLGTKTDGMSAFGGSWPPTFINGISNKGQIVGQNAGYPGYGYFPTGSTVYTMFLGHATSWTNGVPMDLGTLGGASDTGNPYGYSSAATGLNDLGVIVGWSTTIPIYGYSLFGWDGSVPVHAVLWMPTGEMHDLGTLGSDTYATASKVNFYGEVVGISGNSTQVVSYDSGPDYDPRYVVVGRPFIWSESAAMTDLNTLIGADSHWVLNTASDINALGEIVGEGTLSGEPHGFLLSPIYNASVQQPIEADGSSVFKANRGVVPVKFGVTQYGTQQSCTLPATIGISKVSNGALSSVDESTYSMSVDGRSNFRIDATACQYVYNLAASALGVGTYRVDISINGIMVGHAVFALK